MWRINYESDTFVQDMDDLWEEVKPLYDELHTYVLNKLRERYPQLQKDKDNLIPAHILGKLVLNFIHFFHLWLQPGTKRTLEGSIFSVCFSLLTRSSRFVNLDDVINITKRKHVINCLTILLLVQFSTKKNNCNPLNAIISLQLIRS